MTKKTKRILYFAGPGDVIGTYRHWRDGRDDPSQMAVTYSGLFFDVCRERGLSAIVIANRRPHREKLVDQNINIQHSLDRMHNWRGPFFHLGRYLFHFSIVFKAIWKRCDTLILTTGTHLAPFWLVKCLGKKIILTEHCVLWRKKTNPRLMQKAIHAVDRYFYRHGCDVIMAISKDVSSQIIELTAGNHAHLLYFLPYYRQNVLSQIPEVDLRKKPYRIFFAGRIEANKGVFDIIEIAKILNGKVDVVFDIAGDGRVLPDLKKIVDDEELATVVRLHGYCQKSRMRELLSACHAIIIPTKIDFIEGFNKVVAEAVLSHRPFITSDVCPALEYVREAGIEVEANNIQAYADAIVRLYADPELHKKYTDAARILKEQFFDHDCSWGAGLNNALDLLHHNNV